jgi:glutamine amidotransferase
MGNIHSVNKALQLFGAETLVTNIPGEIEECSAAVLPGVGAFDDAVNELEKQGLTRVIIGHVKNKKPLLGICLGMQLLFENSEEGKCKGLGILKGSVKRFPDVNNLKVPHMGWNSIRISGECGLLKAVADNSFVYFCHSYYPAPNDKSVVTASCKYGLDFAAAVCSDNVSGVQFHPEKSQAIGLKIMENFVKLC